MSSIPYKISSIYYDDIEMYSSEQLGYSIDVRDEQQSSFYSLMKVLSSIIVLGFLAIFILSLVSILSLHWSIGLIGLLGSIGLSGSIWLSKKSLTIR